MRYSLVEHSATVSDHNIQNTLRYRSINTKCPSRVRSRNNGMRCMSYYVLINTQCTKSSDNGVIAFVENKSNFPFKENKNIHKKSSVILQQIVQFKYRKKPKSCKSSGNKLKYIYISQFTIKYSSKLRINEIYTYMASGPLDVLLPNLVKSRSRAIGDCNDRIALKYDRHLSSAAAEVPVKFQNEWKSLNPNLAASRLC